MQVVVQSSCSPGEKRAGYPFPHDHQGARRAALHEALRESDADVAAGRIIEAEEKISYRALHSKFAAASVLPIPL